MCVGVGMNVPVGVGVLTGAGGAGVLGTIVIGTTVRAEINVLVGVGIRVVTLGDGFSIEQPKTHPSRGKKTIQATVLQLIAISCKTGVPSGPINAGRLSGCEGD